MKKIFKIIIINILLLIFFLFAIEIFIWGCENLRMKIYNEEYIGKLPLPFHPEVKNSEIDINSFSNEKNKYVRTPEGLNYKNKPIVIFGCSYAYGYKLKKNQTFSHKLSIQTKRPVYNRAVAGWGVQHMLYQVKQDEFYKKVPEPEYVIYLEMKDHFRRAYVTTFLSGQLLNEDYYLTFQYKNGKLLRTPKVESHQIYRRLYLFNKLHHYYVNNIVLNPRNYDKYSKFIIEHFVESRDEMKKHWKNTKFVILLYNSFYNDSLFKKSLEEKGFTVIKIPDITNVDLYSSEYLSADYHPTEKAWNLLTPIIIDKLKLNN